MVKDTVGRPLGELEVSRSVECDTVSLRCSDAVVWATGRIFGLEKAGSWFVLVVTMAPVVTATSKILRSSKIQSGMILVPAYTGCRPWSWKVMEFRKTIFQAWKVRENKKVVESHGKVMENDDNVMEFLLLH